MKVSINDIQVKGRIRKETGDLNELARSMKEHGLINPLTITGDMVLLAGFRRLEAARLLGWEAIECSIIDAPTRLEKLQIEVNENLYRKKFTENEESFYKKEIDYESSRGLKRFFLWIKRMFSMLQAFLYALARRLFRKE